MMAGVDLPFACKCGKVHGSLRNITPAAGTQIQCHCDDCRRVIVWLGQPDPGADGVRYYQTAPERVQVDAGELAAFTWKNPKLVRWYAPCCNTSMFNSFNSPKWAFASVSVDTLTDATPLGATKAHAFVPKPNGKRGHTNIGSFIWGFAKRVIGARLTGTWRKTPFFDNAGSPVALITALTHEDRAKATL